MTEKQFEKCILAMNRGDRDGLREVYEAYASYIYGIVRALVARREEAEDITADFFIKLWEKSDVYRPGGGHKGWMATIARNLAIDHIRKRKREELVDFSAEGAGDEEGAFVTGGAWAAYKAKEAASRADAGSVEGQVIGSIRIEEAFAKLKEAERQVVHMKIMGELTFQEIADILDEPRGTVSWRYREAIKKLRRCGYAESD